MGSDDLTEFYARFKITFFEECKELLADLEYQLSRLEDGEQDSEILHAIFRVAHSIKAGAATFGYTHMVRFTHNFEALLDRLRTGKIAVNEDIVGTLFRASDLVADLVDCAQDETELGDEATKGVENEIQMWLGVGSSTAASKENAPKQNGEPAERMARFRIDFKPHPPLYRNASEPVLLFRELAQLGSLEILGDISGLPPLTKMEPEDAYLSWTLYLETSASTDSIEEVFEFVEDECSLSIKVTDVAEDEGKEAAFGLFSDDDGLQVSVPAAEEGFGLFEASVGTVPSTSGPEIPQNVVDQIAAAQSGSSPTQLVVQPEGVAPVQAKVGSIRVDLDRVDRLVNMVGELVITQSMLAQEIAGAAGGANNRIGTGMQEMSQHIRELQDNVMAIRMQPVKSVFSRMPRLVRELSGKLEKKVKLVTSGENTEVDKTVIEELADPLTHMIRNSLDHGLEKPEERRAAGKPEEGTITLSAEHRGGRIVIQIVDDGRGINRQRVLAKARENGIVAADATPSDEEIDNLIFAPGFSTADEVTDLSGRGVGMDVVRRNIQGLGGRVSLQSVTGQGTKFQMTLPLTLAVLDGMVVGLGEQKYVVPINNIIETVRPAVKDVEQMVGGGKVVRIRGQYVRLIPLGRIFGEKTAEPDPSKGLVVLVEADGGRVVGLVVDYLAGQQQVVIKSLESNYRAVEGIASATILGDGSVCLILDIDGLADMEDFNRTPKAAE